MCRNEFVAQRPATNPSDLAREALELRTPVVTWDIVSVGLSQPVAPRTEFVEMSRDWGRTLSPLPQIIGPNLMTLPASTPGDREFAGGQPTTLLSMELDPV